MYDIQPKVRNEGKLLIEQQSKTLFRVVCRECTWRGFSREGFSVASDNHPDYRSARVAFDEIRGGPR